MTDDELKKLLGEMRREQAAAHAETRRHFDITLERIESRFELLGESVSLVHDELLRTRTSLDEKIERTAGETQAMIRFSHAELERRVRALEETQRTVEQTLSDVQARLERLEGSTH